MTDFVGVRSWLFKGLAAEATLDDLEAEGLPVRAATDPRALQRVMPLEDFSDATRRAAMRALPAYLAFFCFENSVRDLVRSRLAENHGKEWWTDCVSKRIRDSVEKRQDSEGSKRWHTRRGESEIYYTDFGDLSSIIVGNWADFEDLMPDQNWVSTRMAELEASRNIIAHSNVLDERELQRIKLYLEDWTRQVG